uniref:Uncharacterized protein n=1 Tax=Caenorhabditis tropicalis TaxID=1561998 RepID=A0A1I7TDU6_9PELO
MSETVSLKRPRSTSNVVDEPEEKYVPHSAAQHMFMNQAALATMPVGARGVQPVGFPLMQYCQMIQQMQHQQMELSMGMMRKDKDDAQSTSTTPATSRRQTMSNPSIGPRPIRVPSQSIFNPLQFGLIPHPQQLVPPIEDSMKSPSPSIGIEVQSLLQPYNSPCFQKANEEIYSKFVESVRKLASKLAADKS